jgi:23S rRNA-/tRNA-specific pseudouridylate synthase
LIPILFEDEFLVIVNKPAGIASEEIITQNGHWFLVHRLDQRVSGLLIFAKTTEAITALNEMFVIGSIQKIQSCSCCSTKNFTTNTYTLVGKK